MHAVGGLQRFVTKKSSKVFSLLPRMLSSDKGAGFGTWDGKISKRTGEEIDLLDVGVITKTRGPQPSNGDMPSASSAVKGRLNRPLQKQEKKVLSGPQLGALEATAEDLYDVLCDALSSSSFHNLFRGTSDASEAVDFVDCKLNADCSHATVRWKSPVIAQFAKVVYKKKGPAQAQKFSKNAIKYINKKLAGRESQFRSVSLMERGWLFLYTVVIMFHVVLH